VKNKDPENSDKDEDEKFCERLQYLNTIGDSEIIHNLLMISGVDENNNSYHKYRFEENVKNCEGKISRSICHSKKSNISLFTCS
jgi:hypothetical protein